MRSFIHQKATGPCPHCGVVVQVQLPPNWTLNLWTIDGDAGLPTGLDVHAGLCPNCEEPVLDLVWWSGFDDESMTVDRWVRAYPQLPKPRPEPAPEVQSPARDEYIEAARVEGLSQRSAAGLLRRCLQTVLRQQGFKASDLNKEIEAAAASGRVSSRLRTKLHIVRQVGNYSLHPILDGHGDPLAVEPGEVDALFGALDEAFDVFYVKPSQDAAMLKAINKKLEAAGKPLIDEKVTNTEPDGKTMGVAPVKNENSAAPPLERLAPGIPAAPTSGGVT